MTQIDTRARSVAPVLSLPSCRAARTLHLPGRSATPAPSVPDTTQAEAALPAALELLRAPHPSTANIRRATSRTCRAATLMKRACAALVGGRAA